ncbi:MAG: prolipoprotein diacylglyceryl transferase [Ruminiclostridium sp.]|nr:prolipoprotein diacylglyceryl transferase [Ruminiclostridium sp.]
MISNIEIFGRSIPTYSLCAVLGGVFLVLYFFIQTKFPRKGFVKVECQDMLFMLVYAGVAAFIGAKLMFIVTSVNFNWYEDKTVSDNLKIWLILIITGGIVFYGGLIGAAIGAFIYAKKFSVPYSEIFDLALTGVPLFHAFGRIGCFLAGCCYGMEYHGTFAVVYPEGNTGGAPSGVELLPIQLIEAAANLAIWVFLAAVYRKTKRRWFPSGLYLVSYGVIRFILEFFRGDMIRGHLFMLSSSQVISIFAVGAGVLLIVRPNWLERFGSSNDEKYILWTQEQKKRVSEYKAYKAAKKAGRRA